MIIIITGASHTGKTKLAQQLLEKYHYPYLSQDHLKMGLIRSGETDLTPEDDDLLVPYLWNITKEIIKTAVENQQHLIVEGCYVPFNWQEDFAESYLSEISYYCLIMSEAYIRKHFTNILNYGSVIEKRLDDASFTIDIALRDNLYHLQMCEKNHLEYVLIDQVYDIPFDL